jgi:tetratricopeptide (TPR) repeat protein
MFRAIPRTTIGAATVEARALGPERQDIDGDGPSCAFGHPARAPAMSNCQRFGTVQKIWGASPFFAITTMTLRAQLDAVATLLDEGAASSAVRMLRSSWEPELPVEERIPLYCMWIRALCDTHDLSHALTLAERAADELPREPDVLIALGNVYDLRGELEKAADAFRRSIEHAPDSALAHYDLGAVLERLGDEDGAEAAYRDAMAIEVDGCTMFEAAAALGALLRRTGRLDEAASVYDAYLDEDPINVDILVEHGICLSDLEELEDAVERFELALSLEPKHSSAWYNLAITLYRMGQPTEALGAMENAYRSDPRSPLTLAVLGSWQLAQDETNLDDALSLLYRALDILDDLDRVEGLSTGYASLVYEEVFEALWQRGRHLEARRVAQAGGQRDWITAHMLNTLNEADNGRSPRVTAFQVLARAEAPQAPEHWPEDAHGYTTGLTVLASNEDEAAEYSLRYLRSIEPSPVVQFKIETVREGEGGDLSGENAILRARGVVGVSNARAYFRQ